MRIYWISLVSLCLSSASAELGKDWTAATGAAPWSARYDHAAVTYNGKMWLIGGIYGMAEVWSSSNGSSWTLATTTPAWGGKWGHTALVHNGKMWVIGGGSFTSHNDVWYSSDGVKWTSATLHAPWAPRSYHAAVSYNGKIWVVGGYDQTSYPPVYRKDVWYSRDGTSWTCATTASPLGNQSCLTGFVFDGRMWVIGYQAWCSTNGTSWTCTTGTYPPWSGGSRSGAVVCDGRIWVMGGNWGPPFLASVNDVWCSRDGWKWTRSTAHAAWRARESFSVVVHNRKMWVLGGVSRWGYHGGMTTLLNDVWYSSMPAGASAWKLYP